MQILVIGSMNMDLVVQTEEYPSKGETIKGYGLFQIPGGKGTNQACAVGKLGGDVGFIGACGWDEYAEVLLANLNRLGVSTCYIERVNKNTGIGMITVEKSGDNRIIVIPGANEDVTPAIIEKNKEVIKQSNIILLQMEIPLDTVIQAIEVADRYDKIVILDPAPAYELPDYILKKIDYLLPNEGEINGLVPDPKYKTLEDKACRLLELGVGGVVLTRGSQGSSLYRNGEKAKHFAAEKVKTVDTTAAGDAFAGGFAYCINLHCDVENAIKFANVVGGLTTTKLGAQSSLPDINDVKEHIALKRVEGKETLGMLANQA